jgi:hypothetical protein
MGAAMYGEWRDHGRVRPAIVIGLRPAAAQLRPENSAGCGFGQHQSDKCHALLAIGYLQHRSKNNYNPELL